MSHYTKDDIMKKVKDEDVKFIRLQFTDLFGATKNLAITASELEKALDGKCMFDNSSIRGFDRMKESDLYLSPDTDSYATFPWRPQQGKVMRLICDIKSADGTPFVGDSRQILKKTIQEAEKMGFSADVGPECEFFLFHTDEDGRPTTKTHDAGGYLDIAPLDMGENCRRDICLTLEEMGFLVESSHHEVAKAQHEVDFHYDKALSTADKIMTFKMVVKSIAQRHGLYATFMPKPVGNENGSGMHLNISLTKDGKNAFYDGDDPYKLSTVAYQFMAGVLAHIKGICAICNPLVNSYKRLVSGYEAPVDIVWSGKSRSPLVRIPAVDGENSRLELRSPDSSANPYLALAVILKAGLWGIQNNLTPPASVDGKEPKAGESLPETLKDALDAMEADALIRETLGEETFQCYLDEKRAEWDAYRKQVTSWEIEQYLSQY